MYFVQADRYFHATTIARICHSVHVQTEFWHRRTAETQNSPKRLVEFMELLSLSDFRVTDFTITVETSTKLNTVISVGASS